MIVLYFVLCIVLYGVFEAEHEKVHKQPFDTNKYRTSRYAFAAFGALYLVLSFIVKVIMDYFKQNMKECNYKIR